jgi:RNA polymerase sigma factor (TIGR02999 family)
MEDVTRLLGEWRSGNAAALDSLTPLVYRELHRLAAGYLRRERPGHTLQPTALINEAYLRLAGQGEKVDWASRSHFVAVAAQHMRQILVDHARRKLADKRGAGAAAVSLDDAGLFTPERSADLLALDEAIGKLAESDARKARAVELRYFGGLELQEIADVTGVSLRTVQNDLRMAQAWLKARLSGI